MLDSKPLRYFVATAEERHFSRAADRLFVTQSALSTQILNLEKSLGTKLLNRNKRSLVTLTTAGQLFLDEARKALAQIDYAEHIGKRAGRGEVGHIKVGYVASAVFSGLLPKVLRIFHEKWPGVTLSLQEITTPKQYSAISSQQLDIGFVRPHSQLDSRIKTKILHYEDLRVALASNHKLASMSTISVDMLHTESFIEPQFDEPAGFEQQVALILGNQAKHRVTHKTRDFLTAVTLVSSGYGVAIVPKSASNLSIDNVVFLPLENNTIRAELAIAFREDETSEAVLNMADIAQSSYQ
ncbi:LysR substrate-binding domain-containing protein [Agarilytica rhodophyticola]|uniref:LysR substrate-binding domain-containing protein n=1 Tax=Agarilytica rhodophyticola TaxID=1737490 RepID=UPI000B3483B8|nr:LysR substrate-binding domain-containing protein [Agarilytica rhodophyticola]